MYEEALYIIERDIKPYIDKLNPFLQAMLMIMIIMMLFAYLFFTYFLSLSFTTDICHAEALYKILGYGDYMQSIGYYLTHRWLNIIPLIFVVLSIFGTLKILVFGKCPLISKILQDVNFTELLKLNVIVVIVGIIPTLLEFIIISSFLLYLFVLLLGYIEHFLQFANDKFNKACMEKI